MQKVCDSYVSHTFYLFVFYSKIIEVLFEYILSQEASIRKISFFDFPFLKATIFRFDSISITDYRQNIKGVQKCT